MFFVRYEHDGSTTVVGTTTYTATSTLTHGNPFTLLIDTLPGATCSLSESTGKHPALDFGFAAPASTPAFVARWGRDGDGKTIPYAYWPAGYYTIKVTCSLAGYNNVTANKTIH